MMIGFSDAQCVKGPIFGPKIQVDENTSKIVNLDFLCQNWLRSSVGAASF